jgi:ribosome-binding factor A
MDGRRPGRLGGQIQEEVSDIIRRKLKDPRLGFITITRVHVTGDLRHATVYVSVMGSEEEIESNLGYLDGASNFIRSELGKRIRVKHIPDLKFRYDDSGVTGARIEKLLRHLKKGQDDTGLPGDS